MQGDHRVGMNWDLPGTALKIARRMKNYLLKSLAPILESLRSA
jgi:hypothetical protein